MSIVTDSFISINDGGIEVSKIGISSPLGAYTLQEIYDSAYCGQRDKLRVNNILGTEGDVSYLDGNQYFPYPSTTEPAEYTWNWKEGGSVSGYTDPNGLFGRIIWLHSRIGSFDNTITEDNINNYEIVTSWTVNNFVFTLPSISQVHFDNSILPSTWNDNKTFPTMYYAPGAGSLDYHTHLGYPDDNTIQVTDIRPYVITQCASCWFVYLLDQSEGLHSFKGVQDIYSADPKFGVNDCLSYHKDYFLGTAVSSDYFNNNDWSFSGYPGNTDYPFQFVFGSYGALDRALVDPEQKYLMFWTSGGNNVDAFSGMYVSKFFVLKHDSLMFYAGSGVKFYADQLYKPIIEDGIVVDFSSDMTKESELDDWDGSSQHRIVDPTPPTPDDPWDVDAETYGWGGNEVGGMVRYYLLTSTEMDNLVSAMGSSNNWVIDYLNNIVSCFIVPNDGLFFDAPVSTTVKFRVDNNHEWDTGVSCKRISGVVNKSGGTIEIPRCTNSFLDFEPYSDYSIYIPFCGRVPIKGNIVCGREVTVTYYPDVPTCSLTAVVTCGGSTVAIAKGQYGSMIPVTSSGADRKTAAAISDVSSIITGLGVGIAGAATGNAGLLIAGGSQLVGGLLNAAKDSVQSYAYSSGSSGDTSFFAAGTRCQYYVNYLQLDNVVNSTEFGHTIGYLCNEIGKLSNYHGFTICANPHIHISATSTEKEEIKQLLEQGVILP